MIYWSMQSIPELSSVPRERRAKIVKLCLAKTPSAAQFAVVLVGTFAFVALAQSLGVAINGWQGFVAVAVAALFAGFVGMQVRIVPLRQVVRAHLELNEAGTLDV